MKKYLLIFYLIILNNSVFGQNKVNNKDFDHFCKILAIVESGGKTNVIGDNGKAIGIFQIHYSYWKDATDFNKSIKGKYEDCFNPEYAKRIVNSYLTRYCKSNNFEDMARCHNSGPDWKNKKKLTDNYWKKFEKLLASSKF